MKLVIVRSEVNEFVTRFSQVADGHASSLFNKLGNSFVLVHCDVDELAAVVENSRQSSSFLQIANPINDVLKTIGYTIKRLTLDQRLVLRFSNKILPGFSA